MKMRRYTLILLLFLSILSSCAQTNSPILAVNIKNVEPVYSRAFLVYENSQGQKTLVDTATVKNNFVDFSIPDTLKNRALTLGFFFSGNNKPYEMPILYTNDDKISIEITFPDIIASCKVVNSDDNKMFYDFIIKNKDLQSKQSLVSQLIGLYSDKSDDDFYKSLQAENENLMNQQKQLAKMYSSSNSDVQNFIRHQIEMSTGDYSKLAYPNDELFLNSPMLFTWIWTYINNFQNNDLQKNEQVVQYNLAIDSLSSMFIFYPHKKIEVFKIIAKEMENAGYDEVSLHIYDIISPEMCEPDTALTIKADCLKKIQVGNQAPDINFDYNIGVNSLYEIDAEYTLVIFWASWCTHCQQLIPEIKQLYDTYDNFKVLAISIDDNEQNWKDFLKKNNLDWYNYCDFKAWESVPAKDYCVSGTPTIFILNRDKKIIAKPLNISDIKAVVE